MTEQLMIQAALDRWRYINSNPYTWATFEAVRFPKDIVAIVKWGDILSDGLKSAAIQSLVWTLHDSGRYETTKLNHR